MSGGTRSAMLAHNRRVGRRGRDSARRHKWAPEIPAGITFHPYGTNERGVGGYSKGGYVVHYYGIEIGTIERFYPTWDRKPKGLRYVTARGVSHKPAWSVRVRNGYQPEFRSRADAVEFILKHWQEKHGVKKLKTRLIRIDPEADCTGPHEIDQAKVREFTELKRTGTEFPPVRLVAYSGFFMIIDGHHRVTAYQTLGHSFEAHVADGDEFDQLDLDLKDAMIGKRADDIEFWDIPETCVACGATGTVTESIEEQTFAVGCAPDPVIDVTCKLPVMTCSACEMQWTDYRGEEIRDKAAREQTPYFKKPAG